MKKTTIVLTILLTIIAACIFITAFVGWGVFGFGQSVYPHNAQPPPANATLFEKAEWEEHHGSICQCSPALVMSGPIQIIPVSESRISKMSFNISLTSGMVPVEMGNTSFTISTKSGEKTVGYPDPSVDLKWILENGTVMEKQDYFVLHPSDRGSVLVELDLEKMGFISPALGPDERFSLVITPPQGYRYAITLTTPAVFHAGTPLEVPGWYRSPFSH